MAVLVALEKPFPCITTERFLFVHSKSVIGNGVESVESLWEDRRVGVLENLLKAIVIMCLSILYSRARSRASILMIED